ncbi:PAS domain S-box protein [Leptospira fletcheri]|uniref:Sensor protein FixL n=1 Tax=Leptospira fletcheri TaxID=2484981 RepID=A0A4R9G5W7_9LEPT|nr:PAS domain S-box protein [Leptospira fletcheri]TGK06340.1 PAS domain S-box protein [Leptospira fletcheri]
MSREIHTTTGISNYKTALRQKWFSWKDVSSFFEQVCNLALEQGGFFCAFILEWEAGEGKWKKLVGAPQGSAETLGDFLKHLPEPTKKNISPEPKNLILSQSSGKIISLSKSAQKGTYSAMLVPILNLEIESKIFLFLVSDDESEFNEVENELLADVSYHLSYAYSHLIEQNRRLSAQKAMATSEKKFLAIFETVVDAIILITEGAEIIMFNPAAEKMFGFSSDEVTGKNVKVLMPDPFYSEHDSYIERYIHTSEKRIIGIGREVLAIKQDGTIFPIELAVSEVHLDGHRYFVGVIRDITRRKNAEDSLVAKNEELELLNKSLEARIDHEMSLRRERERTLEAQSRMAAMGEMIGNIAHQWRQPLNAISILIQEMEFAYTEQESDEKYVQDTTARILDLLQSMSQTIDDFRNFYKPNKEKETFSLRNTVEKSLSLVAASMKNQNIKIETHFSGNDTAYGYPNELAQVLLNILSNAKDALLQHKPEIPSILVRIFSEEDRKIVVVKDNGGGFDSSVGDKIFLPYFSTKEQGAGVGLGLYMSKAIVEKNMGGKLTASSDGVGAEFRIELP